MKRFSAPIILSFTMLAVSCGSQPQGEFPTLEGPYMGQTPPGMMAEPFAPGVISKEGWELEGVFAPGMKEFYFTLNRNENTDEERFKPTVIGFRQDGNIWMKYLEFPRRGEVAFSPDGQRMHMAKGYKDRIGDGWSERKSLGPMFDREDRGIMRLTASANGTYVFDDYKSGDVIRISRLKDGERQEPEKMSPAVNSGKLTAHPFIAPDESYLIWDSEREGGYGDSDLYISFRQQDGSWGPAINMGDTVNSDKWDAYASVTPDGKYILFNRGIDDGNDNVDVYWVDARIIETLRAKFPEIKAPYLGQEPPGLIPEPFAPGIVSTDGLEVQGAIAPAMNEFYFLRQKSGEKSKNLVVQYKNGTWQETVVETPSVLSAVFISTDGNKMHSGHEFKDRTDTGWSGLKSLGPMFEREDWDIMRLTASASGTYVFDVREDIGTIRSSRLVDGKREKPQALSHHINTGKWTAHPFIAPDESYLIWDSEREGGYGETDLYISFRQEDGTWGPAINMGEDINTEYNDTHGSVTPDGRYFFYNTINLGKDFASSSANIYWVDAQIIETLKPKL